MARCIFIPKDRKCGKSRKCKMVGRGHRRRKLACPR